MAFSLYVVRCTVGDKYLQAWQHISFKNTRPLFCDSMRLALKRPYKQCHAYKNALRGKGIEAEVIEYKTTIERLS